MKVTLVNKLYYPVIGGVENHVRTLALKLPDSIEREILVCGNIARTVVEEIDGVKVIRAGTVSTVRSNPLSLSFPLRLRAVKTDLFHFHFPFPTGEISTVISRLKIPYIVTYHSDVVRQKLLFSLIKPFIFSFLNKAKVIIVSSPNIIKTSPLLNHFKDKCRVVPLGIEVEKLQESKEINKKVLGIRDKHGKNLVLFVGRLIYYKGVEYLIRAFKEVEGNLIIIGSGPLEEELKELSSTLGLSNKVSFVPPVSDEDLSAYYHACDVFILPSVARSEAYGLVQMEAMTCGKVVVSTELGTGTSFVNEDGKTGFVVPPKNPQSLAEALNRLLKGRALREKMGKYAQKRVFASFTSEKMVQKVVEIYREVLEEEE